MTNQTNEKYADLISRITNYGKESKSHATIGHGLAVEALRASVDGHCAPLNAFMAVLRGGQRSDFVQWVKTHGKPSFDGKTGKFFLPKGSKKEWRLDEAEKTPFWIPPTKEPKAPAQKTEAGARLKKYLEGISAECVGDPAAKAAVEMALAALAGKSAYQQKDQRIKDLEAENSALKAQLAALEKGTILTKNAPALEKAA
jgi:hypothetical protein